MSKASGATSEPVPPHTQLGAVQSALAVADAAFHLSAPSPAGLVGNGEAHAKVILFGEHSVVYGNPAVALPMSELKMHAQAWRMPGTARLESDYFLGDLRDTPGELASPRTAIEAAVKQVRGSLSGLVVSIRGAIPLGRGLGSSAAAAGAIVEAVARLHDTQLSEEDRFHLVQMAERVAHGRASGLDAYATISPNPIRFQQGQASALQVALSGQFIVADTGVHGSTLDAVEGVRTLRERFRSRIDRVIGELGALADAATQDLVSNRIHELGARMNRAQELLEQLQVSHPSIETLVGAARKAGALGAKLTGAGLGGCIVALVQPDTVAAVKQALKEAGAKQIWTLETTGAHA